MVLVRSGHIHPAQSTEREGHAGNSLIFRARSFAMLTWHEPWPPRVERAQIPNLSVSHRQSAVESWKINAASSR